MKLNKQHVELSVVLVISLVFAISAVNRGRFDAWMGYQSVPLYQRQLAFVQKEEGVTEAITGAWATSASGLNLQPGSAGAITIQAPYDHAGQFLVSVQGHGTRHFQLAVWLSGDGQVFHKVREGFPLDGTPVDLTGDVRSVERIWLQLRASHDAYDPAEELPLISSVRVVTRRPPASFWDLALAAFIVFTPILAYVTKRESTSKGAMLYSLLVLCGLGLLSEARFMAGLSEAHQWWQRVVVSERDYYFVLPYLLLVGVLGWHLKIGRRATTTAEKRWAMFALIGLLAWAAHSRIIELAIKAGAPLEPDVVYYRYVAQTINTPYDTGAREPFWIWMVKGWFWLAGDSQIQIRRLTLLLSLLMILMVYKFFRDYTGSPVLGTAAAAIVALNPYLVYQSVRGLREEAYTIAVLCVTYFVFVPTGKMSIGWRTIGIALAGAATQLLRFNSFLFLIPLLGMWIRRHSPPWRQAVLPFAFIALLSVPHLVHNYQQFGDPVASLTFMAVWSRNYEFVVYKGIGCNGCPTRDEFAIDGYAGTPLGTIEYLFGMHTVQELLSGMLKGYIDLYLRPTSLFEAQAGMKNYLTYAVYLLGLGLILCSQYREMLAVIVLVINVVPFFLSIGFEWRLSVHTIPFVSFILAYGYWWLISNVTTLWAWSQDKAFWCRQVEYRARGNRLPV